MDRLLSVLNPGILFFLLGLGAVLAGANSTIPESVVKFISLYLMLSIGFEEGISLHQSGLFGDGFTTIVMSAFVPIYSYPVFRKSLGSADAAAIGAPMVRTAR